MSPGDRFSAPRRPPPPPAIPDFLGPRYRLPTAPQASTPSLKHQRSDRSLSPGGLPNWWSPRKLFTRKHSTSSVHSDEVSALSEACWSAEEQRSSLASSASQSAPSRSMSPESLRRFLCDETPVSSEAESADRLALSIPDDIAEEDDDDEFAVASAISEFGPKTALSPPPPPRSRHSSSTRTMRRLANNESVVTLKAIQQAQPPASPRPLFPASYTFYQPQDDENDQVPTSRFSFSSDEGSTFDDDEVDPLDSSSSNANDIPSFYHSDAEDDDDMDCLSPPLFNNSRDQSLAKGFEGYRLPRTSIDGSNKQPPAPNSQAGDASVVNSPPLLALPIMDDFASELKSAGLF